MLKKITIFVVAALLLFSCGSKLDYSAYTKAYIDCENSLSELKANMDISLQDTTLKAADKVSKVVNILGSGITNLLPRIQAIKEQASKLAASVDSNSKPSSDDKKSNEEILKHIGLIFTSIDQITQIVSGDADLSSNEGVKSAVDRLTEITKSINS